MPCNTDTLNAAAFLQKSYTQDAPTLLGDTAQWIASTGYSTDGLSAWGTYTQEDGNNAGPPWWWLFGGFVTALSLGLTWLFVVIAGGVSNLPGIGPQLADLLNNASSSLQNYLHTMFTGQQDGFQHILSAQSELNTGLLTAVDTLAKSMIYNGQVQYKNSIAALQPQIDALSGSLNQWVYQLELDDKTYNADAHAYTDAGLGTLHGYVDNWVYQLQLDDKQISADTQNLVNNAISQAQAGDAQTLLQVQTQIQTQVQPQIDSINAQLPALGSAGVAQLLPQLQLLQQAQTATQNQLQQDETNCINPMCENLGDFTKNMGLLNGLGVAAAVIAFIAAAMADPGGVAGAINSVVTPTVDGTVSTTTGVS